jgi:hypothetical protein
MDTLYLYLRYPFQEVQGARWRCIAALWRLVELGQPSAARVHPEVDQELAASGESVRDSKAAES